MLKKLLKGIVKGLAWLGLTVLVSIIVAIKMIAVQIEKKLIKGLARVS